MWVAGLLSLLALLAGSGTAAAGVVVDPDHVEPGARGVTLVFRMTHDDPAVRPVRLQVFLPVARPLVGVTAPAPPGWTARLTTVTLATPAPSVAGPVGEVVAAIEWNATARPTTDPVELPVLVDLMPDGAGPVRFRAVQTDEDGRTVEWSNTWADGAPPPAHDALVVRLGSAAPPPPVIGSHGDHHGNEAAAVGVPTGRAAAGSTTATAVLLVAFAAAVGALTVGLGRRQHRRFEALAGESVPSRKIGRER